MFILFIIELPFEPILNEIITIETTPKQVINTNNLLKKSGFIFSKESLQAPTSPGKSFHTFL